MSVASLYKFSLNSFKKSTLTYCILNYLKLAATCSTLRAVMESSCLDENTKSTCIPPGLCLVNNKDFDNALEYLDIKIIDNENTKQCLQEIFSLAIMLKSGHYEAVLKLYPHLKDIVANLPDSV